MTGEFEQYLAVGAGLFILGAIGFLTRRNLILLVLSVEMMLHGVAITLVTFSNLHHTLEGQAFTVFALTVAACEAGLALALTLALFQKTHSLDIELWTDLGESDVPRPLPDDHVEPAEVQKFPTLTPAGLPPEIELDTATLTGGRIELHPDSSTRREAKPVHSSH